ncbi:MAG: mechanosensitive ion channel domain-containing protein [Pseudomonadota bacterium]
MPPALADVLPRFLIALVVLVAASLAPAAYAQEGQAGSAQGAEAAASGPGRYDALVELLDDPERRDRLIAELERLSAAEEGATDEGAGSVSEPSGAGSTGPVSALTSFVSGSFAEMAGVASRLAADIPAIDWKAVGDLAWRVGAVLVLAYLLLFIGHRALAGTWRRLDAYARAGRTRHRLLRTGLAVLGSLVLDVAVLAMAWLVAQAASWALVGDEGGAAMVAGLALQALLVVEAARLLVGAAFAPASPGLRLLPLSEPGARFWAGWLFLVIRFTGYGGILLVPAIAAAGRSDLASATGWLIALLALGFTWSRLWVARHGVRSALLARAETARRALAAWSLRRLAASWHWLAMFYALGVFVVAITRPGEALPFVALATFNSAVVIGVALFVSATLGQWIGRGVPLPTDVVERMPTLQHRLNTYVPLMLRAIRVVIGLVAVAGLIWVWHLGNIFAWLGSDEGRWLLAIVIDVSLVLLITVVVWLLATGLIEAKLNSSKAMPSARLQTLLALFRSAIAIALVTIAAMVILAELGMNIGPLLAGAGVLGLAIGFGAQKMVQDVITGVFIQIENSMNAGDIVTAAGVTGTAERLSIRSVTLRDLSGTVHVIPFSSVDIVSNYTRDFAYHKGEYGIAYRENVDQAIEQLKLAFDELVADPEWKDHILEPVEIPGVTGLGDSSVNIRVMIKTTPGDQWSVGRAYNRLVKKYFDQVGIEIPFPHTTLYFGVDKDGTAPPANLRVLDGDRPVADEGTSVPAGKPKPPHERVPDRDDVDLPEE